MSRSGRSRRSRRSSSSEWPKSRSSVSAAPGRAGEAVHSAAGGAPGNSRAAHASDRRIADPGAEPDSGAAGGNRRCPGEAAPVVASAPRLGRPGPARGGRSSGHRASAGRPNGWRRRCRSRRQCRRSRRKPHGPTRSRTTPSARSSSVPRRRGSTSTAGRRLCITLWKTTSSRSRPSCAARQTSANAAWFMAGRYLWCRPVPFCRLIRRVSVP